MKYHKKLFVNWLDVDKLKSRLELILMEHLMRSTLTYNATYILEDCTLGAKFQHKYHNDSDRDRELSLVIKMYYFNIRHTMIVAIFYSFVSFNILTQDSSRIKKGKVAFMYDTDILDGIDSPKNEKKRETTLVVKRRSMIILEVNIRKKVSCVFKIFLNSI